MRIKDVLNDASKAEDPKPKRVSEALKAYLDSIAEEPAAEEPAAEEPAAEEPAAEEP